MLKKTMAVFLVCLLAFCAPPLRAAASEQTYLVASEQGTVLYRIVDETATPLVSVPRGTVLTASGTDGEYIRTRYAGYAGYVPVKDLTLYGVSLKLQEIVLSRLPDKTEFYEDDDFTSEGMIVTALYADGTSADVKGYTVSAPDMNSLGEKTVTVFYQSCTAEYTVRVNRLPIERIAISAYPQSNTVIQGTDNPRLPGLELTVYYTDGRAPTQTDSYTLAGYDPETVGEQQVQITYKYPDIQIPFTIFVAEKTVTSLTVSQTPSKQVYYDDDLRMVLDGLVLTAGYDNGKTETVQPESAAFAEPVISGAYNDIILSFGGMTASFPVRVEKTEITGISVAPPLTTDYLLNSQPVLDGLVVYIEYNSGNREGTDEYNIDEIDTSSYGKKTVNVYYESYSASFEIRVVSDGMRGDINKDGKVNSSDARLALRYSARLELLTDEQIFLGDINSDGKITSSDARQILRAAAKLEEL